MPDDAPESDADIWGASAAPPATPPTSDIQVFPHAAGVFYDKGGAAYSQSPTDPTLLLDTAGNKYTWDNGQAQARSVKATPIPAIAPATTAPTGVETDADIWGAPESGSGPTPVTAAGVGAHAAQGALSGLQMDSNVGLTALNPLTAALSSATSMVDPIAAAIQRALGNGTPAPLSTPIGYNPVTEAVGQGTPGSYQIPRIAGPPGNDWEKNAELGGNIAFQAATMGPEALGPRLMSAIAPTAGGVAGQQISKAFGANPQDQDFWSNLGAIAGGVGGHAALNPSATFRGIVDPITAQIGGQREVAPGVMGNPNAANQAGRFLWSQTSNPAAVGGALAGVVPETVPGSARMLGAYTGDPGLLAHERIVASQSPTEFNAAAGAQNKARLASLNGVQVGGNSVAPADYFRSQVQALDRLHQGDIDRATAQAPQIGGEAPTEQRGATMRGSLQANLDASDATEDKLWGAVDPNKDLTANTVGTREAGLRLVGNNTPYDTPLSSDEKRIYNAAADLKPVDKFDSLVRLRRTANAALRAETGPGGNNDVRGRLTDFVRALNDNLTNTATDAYQRPGAADRIQAFQDGQQPTSQVRTAQSGNGTGDQPMAGTPAPVSPGAGGTALPPSGGPGGAPGAQGVSGQISPDLKPIEWDGRVVGYETPTGQSLGLRDAAAWSSGRPSPAAPAGGPEQPTIGNAQEAHSAAIAFTKNQKETFAQGPVKDILAVKGGQGNYILGSGNVPSKVFNKGATGYDDAQAYLKANPQGMPDLVDAAAATLRATAMRPDGTIDPVKFAKWQADYGNSLRALPPEARSAFGNAATAGAAVDVAVLAKKTELAAYQAGAIGKIMGVDNSPDMARALGSVMSSGNRVAQLTRLAQETAQSPEAREGLRRAVMDYMTGPEIVGNTEAGLTGEGKINADRYQTFARTTVPALVQSGLFTPAEGARFTAIANDINESQRSLSATRLPGQSNTYADLLKGGVGPGTLHTLFDLVGGYLGEHIGAHMGMGGLGGVAAAGAGAGLAELAQRLAALGIRNRADLVRAGTFDANVGRALMARVKAPISTGGGNGADLLSALAPAAATVITGRAQTTGEPRTLRSIMQPQAAPAALQGVM